MDVGIKGDRIAGLGDLASGRGGEVVDATGQAILPGFIDADSLAGITLVADGSAESYARQGITSAILTRNSPAFAAPSQSDLATLQLFGNGSPWNSFTGFISQLEAQGTAVNVGTLVPADKVANGEQLQSALQAGALGVTVAGFGPNDPAVVQSATEVVEMLRERRGVYATTVPAGISPLDVIDGLAAVASKSGLSAAVLMLNRETALTDAEVETIARRVRPLADGGFSLTLVVDPLDAAAQRLFEWSGTIVGTGAVSAPDSGALVPLTRPASFSAFAKFAETSRSGRPSLPSVAYQGAALPAARFGLSFRGEIRERYYADLVVLDPAKVQAKSTGQNPAAYPQGINYVMVNGVFTVTPSGHTGSRPGRMLRGGG